MFLKLLPIIIQNLLKLSRYNIANRVFGEFLVFIFQSFFTFGVLFLLIFSEKIYLFKSEADNSNTLL